MSFDIIGNLASLIGRFTTNKREGVADTSNPRALPQAIALRLLA